MMKKINPIFLALSLLVLSIGYLNGVRIQAEETTNPRGTEIGYITQIVNPDGSFNASDSPGNPYVDVSVEVVACHPEGTQFEVIIDGINSNMGSVLAVSPETNCGGTYRITNSAFNLADGVHTVQFNGTYATTSPPRSFYVVNTPPPPATINITPDRAMSWNINGSHILCPTYGLCYSDYAGQTRSYSFDATSNPNHTVSAYAASANVVGYSLSPLKKLTSKLFNFVTASSGSGATCNSSPGGSCSINLTTTYCSTYINGLWNAGNNTADNFFFQIYGPGGTYNIDHTGYYNLVADSSSTTYNVISYPSTTSTQRGYTSDLIRYPYSFTCSSAGGGYMEFEYKSQPILDVR